MKQFSLDKYLENPSRKVVTRDGRVVRIICCDAKNSKPIVALVLTRSISQREFDELTVSYFNDGTYYGKATEDFLDLFFADEEEKSKSIEIPFGAKDSEFVRDEYHIPEGCEARIEGNKVIIEKVQKEELTEFEKVVQSILNEPHYQDIQAVKQWSKTLLDLARKELEKEIGDKCWEAHLKGEEEALKDLPKWKKVPSHEKQTMYGMSEISDVYYNGYFIHLDDIFKALPKEE